MGEDFQFDVHIFSKGLVQPTTSYTMGNNDLASAEKPLPQLTAMF